jgi:hypothetical protein
VNSSATINRAYAIGFDYGLTWWKSGQERGKKEKKKKTPGLPLWLYYRDRQETRQAPTFPAPYLPRHYQTLETKQVTGP